MNSQESTLVAENKIWTKVIPVINHYTFIISLILLLGIDLMIILRPLIMSLSGDLVVYDSSQLEVFTMFAIMLGIFLVFLVFSWFEGNMFKSKFIHSKSRLDVLIVAFIVFRNIVFVLALFPFTLILIMFVFYGLGMIIIPTLLPFVFYGLLILARWMLTRGDSVEVTPVA